MYYGKQCIKTDEGCGRNVIGRWGTNGKSLSCSMTFTSLAARMNYNHYPRDLGDSATLGLYLNKCIFIFEGISEPVENAFLNITQYGCISSDPAAKPIFQTLFQSCRIVHDTRRKQLWDGLPTSPECIRYPLKSRPQHNHLYHHLV